MTLFSVIITSVKYQLKIWSTKYLLLMNSLYCYSTCICWIISNLRHTFSLVFDSRHITTKEYWCPKRISSIQYDYRKWETLARVFSQTLANGNSKIEINNETEEENKRINVERSTADMKKRSPVQSLCDRFRICTCKIKMLSQNAYYYYYYYWWAELQVTFCFVSWIVPIMVIFMFPRQGAST